MTERLYYQNAYLRSFTGRVAARRVREGRTEIALDRTAFYPEGGGQPPDHGLLDAARVVDVQVDDAGLVWHTIEGQVDGEDEVLGQVDWPRRFDHMQQHHGQHLLSAAFEELFHLPTLAFHLGADYASIDLPGDVDEATLRAAEDRTNEVIWEDRPVHARFVTAEELETIPLRKPPTVAGPVRVVSVPDFDHSACGGTHPATTGGVGLLFVRRRERRGAETRIEFVCGGRALRDLRQRSAILGRAASGLSVGLDELETTVIRLREQEGAARKRLAAAMEQLLSLEAGALADAARAAGRAVVSLMRDDLEPGEARTLATALVGHGVMAVIGVQGTKPLLLLARPASHSLDCGAVLRATLAPFGGRGGGTPQMAQGGIPDAARLAEAVEALKGAVA